jgi:hypothetical protein
MPNDSSESPVENDPIRSSADSLVASLLLSILTGLIFIFVGLFAGRVQHSEALIIAGLVLVLLPILLLVLFAVKNPLGVALLSVLLNLVIIGRQCGIMLFFLWVSLVWMLVASAWLGTLAFCFKVLYYRMNATVVEVKVHERHTLPVPDGDDENPRREHLEWIGDFDVPLLERQPEGSKTAEERPEEVGYQMRRFRKKFYVPINLYLESTMDAYVLPTRPREAMLVQLSEEDILHGLVFLVFLSFFVGGFFFPGVLIPIQNFFTTGGEFDFEYDHTREAAVSYVMMMASVAVLVIFIWCRQPCAAFEIESLEQELPELGTGGDHDKPLTKTITIATSFNSFECVRGHPCRHLEFGASS